MIFDIHAHYDDERFTGDRDETLQRCRRQNVGLIINAGADMKGCYDSVDLAKKYDFIYAAVGIHPDNTNEMDESRLEELRKLSGNEKVVAFGEIGLDYYYDNSPRDIQKYWFWEQLKLANELGLPVIIHDRDAHEDIMDMLRKYTGLVNERVPALGALHHFTGSAEMAKELVKMGFYISFGGVLTFKNAKKSREVLKAVPRDRILFETDCPYLTPEPHRGERNDSANIRYVIEKAAEVLNTSREEIEQTAFENGKRLFGI